MRSSASLVACAAACLSASAGAQTLGGLGILAGVRRRRRRAPAARRSRTIACALALAAGLVGSQAAHAEEPLPPLMPVQFHLRAQSVFLETAGTASSNLFSASGGLGGGGPAVSVHGEGMSSVISNDNQASAQALWAFEINGPAGVNVPILITGLYSASIDNALAATGGVAMGLDRFRLNYVMSFQCAIGDSSGCDSSRGDRPQPFEIHSMASSGLLTFLQIATGGALRGRGTVGYGSFDAFVDPLVSIDPTFARAGEFTLRVSPGAGGVVTTVPEPETYMLLLAGLGVVTSIARRRRK